MAALHLAASPPPVAAGRAYPEGLKSPRAPGARATRGRIVNESDVAVNILWVDFNGGEKQYARLDAGKAYEQRTFHNHPWIARTADAAARLLLLNGETHACITADGVDLRVTDPPAVDAATVLGEVEQMLVILTSTPADGSAGSIQAVQGALDRLNAMLLEDALRDIVCGAIDKQEMILKARRCLQSSTWNSSTAATFGSILRMLGTE